MQDVLFSAENKQNKGDKMLKNILTGLAIVAILGLNGCDDASVASRNLSTASDMFEIERRIVFYNGITDNYILTIEGKCSIEVDIHDEQLEVVCKTGENKFKKHFLGISDNVTYFVEQLEAKGVSVYHYRVIFKPQSIIPDIDFRGSTKDKPKTDKWLDYKSSLGRQTKKIQKQKILFSKNIPVNFIDYGFRKLYKNLRIET